MNIIALEEFSYSLGYALKLGHDW